MKKTGLLAMIQLCIIGLFMSSCESVRCISGVIVDEENHMLLSNVKVSWMGNHEMAERSDSMGVFANTFISTTCALNGRKVTIKILKMTKAKQINNFNFCEHNIFNSAYLLYVYQQLLYIIRK